MKINTFTAKKAGFTLVELLVVIAIIAILAAILFPVFAQAKAAAQKTNALSSVRQIAMASNMYSNDYDGVLIRDRIPTIGKINYWWGSFDGTRLQPEEGLLFPYTKNATIQSDPTFPNALRTSIGLTGFGYNYAYLSPTDYDSSWNATPRPVSESQVNTPAETLTFASSARINNWSYGTSWRLEGSPYIDPPSQQYPSIHARHVGRSAVVAWLDGHASSAKVSAPNGEFGFGLQGAWFNQESLGDVLNPTCPRGSQCQDFYYDLD